MQQLALQSVALCGIAGKPPMTFERVPVESELASALILEERDDRTRCEFLSSWMCLPSLCRLPHVYETRNTFGIARVVRNLAILGSGMSAELARTFARSF